MAHPKARESGFYANIEKLRFQRETPEWSLSLGDAYVAFGRGIALNLNRNVDIDLDTSVQGVKGVYRPGDWDLTVVAGQRNVPLFEVTLQRPELTRSKVMTNAS